MRQCNDCPPEADCTRCHHLARAERDAEDWLVRRYEQAIADEARLAAEANRAAEDHWRVKD